MEKEFIHGVMEENMKENIFLIKSRFNNIKLIFRDSEYLFGQMGGDMKDNGMMENKMDRESM